MTNKEDIIYQKVCRMEHGKKVSAFSRGVELIYEFDEWTRPFIEGSKLFVFKDIHSAKFLISNNPLGIFDIFPCICENVQLAPLLIANDFTQGPLPTFQSFWFFHSKGLPFDFYTINTPLGTVIADAVKLVREEKLTK